MAPGADDKACVACAKAKRRCDRQKPACQRCRIKEACCSYPPVKPCNFAVLDEVPAADQQLATVPAQPVGFLPPFQGPLTGSEDRDLFLGLSLELDGAPAAPLIATPPLLPDLTPTTAVPPTAPTAPTTMGAAKSMAGSGVSWFLSSESWQLAHPAPGLPGTGVDAAMLRRVLHHARDWTLGWATTGASPLVHGQLYRGRFPACMQMAFCVVASYAGRSEATTATILRIVEEQANQLAASQGLGTCSSGAARNGNSVSGNGCASSSITGGSGDGSSSSSSTSAISSSTMTGMDMCDIAGSSITDMSVNSSFFTPSADSSPLDSVLDTLARAQALLVYIIIGLLDGDIHARHSAEAHLPLLEQRLVQLLETAHQHLPQYAYLQYQQQQQQQQQQQHRPLGTAASLQTTWFLWILSESIRRLWQTGITIGMVYRTLCQGYSLCCGSLKYTARRGLWDAASAVAWETCRAEAGDPGFSHHLDPDAFYAEDPARIDDFCPAMSEVLFGPERVELWKSGRGATLRSLGL